MRIIPSKPIFFLVAFCLAFATQSSAQQDSVAVDTAAAADTLAAIVAQVDSLTTQQPDSAVATDSLGAPGDTSAARLEAIDSVGAAEPRPAARSSAKPKGPKRKPASSAGAIPVEVIDWDWDDYTHVTAVGFRHLDTVREYELERNEVYMEIWERQKGQQLWVWGESSNLGGGFWAFAPEKFEPLLTLVAADSIATADSVARADSIVTADSLAIVVADSIVTADSIATADSVARVDSIATADSLAIVVADSIVTANSIATILADSIAAATAPAAGAPAQPAVAPAAGSTAPQGTPPATATPEPADTAKAPPAKDKLPPSGSDSTKAPPEAKSDSSGGDKGSGGPQP